MSPNPAKLTFYERTPFSQVPQFAGIQAIVENVAEARKIHIIDSSIRSGVQWTIFMQALTTRSECPLELLKITAVGITSKHLIEETVSDMLDLKEDLFELDVNETVAVFFHYSLHSMISQQNRLECIMEVVRRINPCILVATEAEANHNSPAFVSRFVEALFFYAAYFDCLETSMKENESHRMILESEYFGEAIMNILAAEGEERKVRNVKIDVWRAFFARYGMVEAELSMSSLYQANMVVQKFDCKSFCTLDMNAKSLIIGWKVLAGPSKRGLRRKDPKKEKLRVKKDIFNSEAGEVVAVYSPILQPTCFESLIRMLRDLNPCVMVLVKVEGKKRIFRYMEIDAWRILFTRFGMMGEKNFSMSSFCREGLLGEKKKFACVLMGASAPLIQTENA
ncbi:della protein gai1 [Quercus suber]|uniref:Della protein gai1 n=1 Tax=Quercus suber TaxID=58331 RepID=A0AAW0JXB3_QUESU